MSEAPIYIAAAPMHVEKYEQAAEKIGMPYRSVVRTDTISEGILEARAILVDDSLEGWQKVPRDALKLKNKPPIAVFTNELVKPCHVFAHIYRKNGNIADVISKVTAEKPNLLIAEDEESVRRFVGHFFEREGYNVRAYDNWQKAKEHLPWAHVVLSDVDVPEKGGGYMLFMEARSLPTHTPFVLMSGSPIDPTYVNLAEGAFMKPPRLSKLRDIINVLAPEHLKPTTPEEFL